MAKPVKKKTAAPKKIREVKSKGGDWSLSKFSETLDQLAKERELKHKEQAKSARAALPKWIADLPTASPDALIAMYDDALQGAFSNHHLMVVLAEWKDAIRSEMIKRMLPKKGK